MSRWWRRRVISSRRLRAAQRGSLYCDTNIPVLEAVWNPAGGVRYHLRARRYRPQLWAAFRAGLDAWFERWQPDAKRLAIVGPSGGYCLPLSVVSRFDEVVCFEPDPIARFVLSRRLRALPGDRKITWITHDVWVEPVLRGDGPRSGWLRPDTALFFSNFVGQLMFLVADPVWPEYQRAWRERVWPLLETMPWASFHDRLSGPIAPTIESHKLDGTRLSDSKLLKWYGSHEAGELLDHASGDLLPTGASYGYFHWPLTPDQHHLIEAVVSTTPSKR